MNKVFDDLWLQFQIGYCEAKRANQAEAELRETLDRQQRKERYDQVIKRFNRVHGQKPKTTLADICAEMGESYEAVRKYRLRTGKNKS